MPWTCYSCGTKNPNSADECKSCGGNTAAPSNFYIHWVFGSTVFFLVVYLAGTFFGGTLVEVAASPTDAEIMVEAKALGAEQKNLMEVEPKVQTEAREKAIAKKKAAMSSLLTGLLYWFIPVILVFCFGGVVGFISDGRTIIEVGIGSVIGQVGGYLIQRFALDAEVGILAVVVVVVLGIGTSMAGAWLGENIQERKERVGG